MLKSRICFTGKLGKAVALLVLQRNQKSCTIWLWGSWQSIVRGHAWLKKVSETRWSHWDSSACQLHEMYPFCLRVKLRACGSGNVSMSSWEALLASWHCCPASSLCSSDTYALALLRIHSLLSDTNFSASGSGTHVVAYQAPPPTTPTISSKSPCVQVHHLLFSFFKSVSFPYVLC